MLISTQTDTFASKFGEHEAIKLLAQIGYDSLDYSMFGIKNGTHPLNKDDYRDYAKSLRKTADEHNIIFNQSHAPFPSYIPDSPDKADYNKDIVSHIIRAMEVTSILGGKITIVHPISFPNETSQFQKEFNINFYNNLLPYCKEFNVKVALENMWGWDAENKQVTPAACSTALEFVDYLDSLDSEWFVACLDIGHGEMQGSGAKSSAELIHALGHRLKSLHVHDNDKIKDSHMLPFTLKINWDEILTALKDTNYSGEFTFEADSFIAKFPQELYISASSLMLDIGKYFIKKYEL